LIGLSNTKSKLRVLVSNIPFLLTKSTVTIFPFKLLSLGRLLKFKLISSLRNIFLYFIMILYKILFELRS